MSRKFWAVFVFAVFALSLCLSNDGLCRGGGSSSSSSGGHSSSSGGFSSGSSGGGRSSGGYSSPSSSGWGSGSSSKSSGGWGSPSTSSPPSKSSGGWGSPSTSTPPSPKGWGASKSESTPSKDIGASGRSGAKAPTKVQSAADKAMYDKAKMSGTAFKSREEATKAFQEKNAGKYAATFKEEPKTRPDYIPQSTTVGGSSYTVVFNPAYGGYGYMSPTGWIMYDAMRDAAMISVLMGRNNYYYGPPLQLL